MVEKLWTAFLLIAIATGPGARADSAEEADCDLWTLDGYQLGMSVDEASGVRGGKLKQGRLAVKEKGRLKGLLWFDGDGRLVQYGALLKNPGHDLKLEMTERLGYPTVDEEHKGSKSIGPRFTTVWETDWINATCNVIVRLRHENIKVYAGDILQVDTDRIYVVLSDPAELDAIDWKSLN